MTAIHIPIRITMEPGKPTRYRALCNHESENKKEFRRDWPGVERQPLSVVTCGTCISRLGRVVVKEEWRVK